MYCSNCDNFLKGDEYCEACYRALEAERDDLKAYADKIAQGYPEGMLPKDIDLLRQANTDLAEDYEELRADVQRIMDRIIKAEQTFKLTSCESDIKSICGDALTR